MKKDISNQKQRIKKICESTYVKCGIVQHQTVKKNFYNSMPRKITDLITAKGGVTKC